MGAGDIRFAVIAGLILSPDKLYFGIMSTYVVGSLVGVIVAIIKRRFRGIPLPFIPFMGIGIFLSYIFAEKFWKFLLLGKLT
jgi:leader peptidase (prepilin peptidase)/N-methyltransferase